MQRETPLALYKGLGAVLSGIVPKMASRFASFEAYKSAMADKQTGKTSVGGVFIGTPFTQVVYMSITFNSWFGSWGDRSCTCRYSNGSCEDPSSGSEPFARRST